jgi:drug/metabolite transporter (DMT)-like permease
MGALGLLAVTGMLGQLGGNVLFQWSLGVVGIALTVPLCLGAMIVSGALLGHWFLHERVSRQMVLAMAVLIVSILILSFGARAASQSVASTEFGPQTANGTLWMIAGVLTACLSGVAYCVLGVAIRHCSVRGVPISTILFTVAMLGTFGLGAMSYVRTGATAMWNTDSNDMAVMLLAGVCNAAAFLALAQALRRAGIVYINSLNASQTAMAALAGVALFGEAPTWAMMLGVLLTAVGLMLMKKDETAATTSELNEALHGPVARFADELAIPISAERSD